MRICELLLAPAYGGAETMAHRLTKRLRELGHEVDLCALDAQNGALLDLNGDILVLDVPRWGVGKRLRRLEALRHHLRASHYDVVHAQTYLPNLYARLAVSLSRSSTPVVISLQSAEDDYTGLAARLSERALSPWTGAVAAVSPRLGVQYVQRFPRLANRVAVVPNAVDIVDNPRLDAVKRPTVFAVVGRLTRFKNVETAIRGFAEFKQRRPGGEEILRIVGPESDEAYAAELHSLVERLGCDAIVFDGPVPGPFDQIPIDVLVHPSRREGHPVTLLEAAAHGIPIVCADVPEISVAVAGHCRTFGLDDESALPDALAALVADWDGARATARHAKGHVPTIEDAADRYLALFESLL